MPSGCELEQKLKTSEERCSLLSSRVKYFEELQTSQLNDRYLTPNSQAAVSSSQQLQPPYVPPTSLPSSPQHEIPRVQQPGSNCACDCFQDLSILKDQSQAFRKDIDSLASQYDSLKADINSNRKLIDKKNSNIRSNFCYRPPVWLPGQTPPLYQQMGT